MIGLPRGFFEGGGPLDQSVIRLHLTRTEIRTRCGDRLSHVVEGVMGDNSQG